MPGSFSLVSAYGGYKGIDIWRSSSKSEKLFESEWIIAHSAGVNYLLTQQIPSDQKIILINPLVKKRNFLSLFIRDVRFFVSEGIDKDKIIPLSDWVYAFFKVLRLLRVDVLGELRKLPKKNIMIIRGTRDNYFCDSENADLIKKEGFTLYEVDAKHNWNKNIADKVKEAVNRKHQL